MTDSPADRSGDLQATISREFPLREGLTILAARIDDHLDQLLPPELESIEKAIDKRKHEFSTGRYLARQAMIELELPPGPILRGEQREPIWPGYMRGSITHAGEWAAVVAARKEALRSIGIDLEQGDRVGEELYGKLFTEKERSLIAKGDSQLGGVMFSAKEAGYKATFPLVGKFIGFQEAEVEVDWATNRFRLRYIGDHTPNQIMDSAEGYFFIDAHYVMSLVIIPEQI